MRQGDPGDALYISVAGRLRASAHDADGTERLLREMGRGQVIGELALFTEAPRSATVVAVRDAMLMRLDRTAWAELSRSDPTLSALLTRQAMLRLQHSGGAASQTRPVMMALLPITAGVDAGAWAQRLAEALRTTLGPGARVAVVDAGSLDAAMGAPGLARSALDDGAAGRRVARHLDGLEAAHDAVLLVGDAEPTAWTARCARHGDERLLLADTTQPPVPHPTEQRLLAQLNGPAEPADVLVLLHPPGTRSPRGTSAWLDRRPVADHVHLRREHAADLARLARIQSRTAVGLVLAGGGARGCAHLGVLRALREQGVVLDFVAGTSIGAIIAGFIAADPDADELIDVARRGFATNPTGDFRPLPLLSLIAGRRMRRVIDQAVLDLAGHPLQAEDRWLNWFGVASNYTQARAEVLQRGPLGRAMRASAAIPGALPPVLVDGDLLCDGGTFNNFPVDLMRARRGVGTVLGMDLSVRSPRRHTAQEVPSTWALLLDGLRPRKRRRYRFPSLMSFLMNVTVLYSSSRHREKQAQADLVLSPPLHRVGILQWARFDDIVRQGHAHAAEVPARADAPLMAALRGRPVRAGAHAEAQAS